MNSVDIAEAIKNRQSVRKFNDQVVPDQAIQEILEAGRWTPSPLNSQPWRFIVLKDRDTLTRLASSAQHAPFLKNVNVAIVVVVENEAKVDTWLAEHNQHIYSGACAMQNMLIMTSALGIGGCWSSLDEPSAREILSIPENYTLIGSIALGYPEDPVSPHTERDRRALPETVFHERFGQMA